MSIRFVEAAAFVALFSAAAHAGTIDGKVETEYVRATKTTPSQDLVFVQTATARLRIDDPAMATTIYRFRGRRVSLEGTAKDGVLTVTEIAYPIRWEAQRGTVGRTNPGRKRFSPRFTPEGGKELKVYGRSYFAMKRIAGKQAVIRGWYFPKTSEVCVTAIRGEALLTTPMLRYGLKITGDVVKGEQVWVHGLSLLRIRALVENGKGEVGHVMLEEVRIGEPETTGKRGMKQALEGAG